MTRRKFLERKRRVRILNAKLKQLFPEKQITGLRHRSHWQLVVAVILSAQTTDKKVDEVTARLFKKYRTLNDYLHAPLKEFTYSVKEIGLYRNKAKNILAAAYIVKERYGGRIPKTMMELMQLPGVGRKTANVVLGNAYGVIEGIAVDTHVKRFAQKFNLTDYADPKKIERDFMKLLPAHEWFGFSNRLIRYGRDICPARVHDCVDHPLTKLYPLAAKRWPRT
ncbi:MAG TPA: endonuclease III [Candidatus Jorgensenbacteria bacterium]|nr:endonuclease III [Candidatus Jorgensenbacteria bacterium]